ncbi:hypothetical protein MMC16_006182 [Acarospora aff. strigata]|nr:hypothetical protein [Acarospora aff. strigata]
MKPRLRNIPQEVVRSRWVVVSDPVRDSIWKFFKMIEKPIIMTRRTEKTRVETQVAVGSVLRTYVKHIFLRCTSLLTLIPNSLKRQLPRIPFPPGTKDTHFSFETVLNSNQVLDSQLIPATHAIGLLKAEIMKEERSLAAEANILQELETNSRAEEGLRKRQAKNVHALLRSDQPSSEDSDNAGGLGLVVSEQPNFSSLISECDPRLEPLLTDLQNHLKSMEANLVQAFDIDERMSRTESLVDDALHKHQNYRGKIQHSSIIE